MQSDPARSPSGLRGEPALPLPVCWSCEEIMWKSPSHLGVILWGEVLQRLRRMTSLGPRPSCQGPALQLLDFSLPHADTPVRPSISHGPTFHGEDGGAEEQHAEQTEEDQNPHGVAGPPVCPGRQLRPGNLPQGHRVPERCSQMGRAQQP